LAEQWSPEDPNGAQLLKTALLKRAMEDVRRILHIKEQKPGLANLVRQGVMGDDVFQKLLEAEADLELEIALVLEEAELYRQGWKDVIFQEATQLYQHYINKESELEAQEIAATRERLEARMKEQFDESPQEPEMTAEERALKAAEELLAEEEAREKRTSSKKNKKKR
jgi:translocation protein SEC66